MRFAILLPLLSLGLAYIGLRHHGWSALMLYPALSCLLVGIAYALDEPRLFGKRPDGTMAWWSLILLFPYIAFSWLLWHAVRLTHRLHSSEPFASQISPTLWLSRRLAKHELPQGVICVVDMTCEFPAAPGLAKSIPHYLVLPTLDYGAPRPEQARALIEKLRTIDGGILIHCAQGHGRSALLTAAYLIATGAAKDPNDALRILKLTRPNIRLVANQHSALLAITNHVTRKTNPHAL